MTEPFPGIGVAGFRSFSDQLEMIGPLDRVTTFVGANNAGKSNCLSLLTRHLRPIFQAIRGGKQVDSLDRTKDLHVVGGARSTLRILWPINPATADQSLLNRLEPLLSSEKMNRGTSFGWLEFEENDSGEMVLAAEFVEQFLSGVPLDWSELSSFLTSTGGGARGDDQRRVLDRIAKNMLWTPPETNLIPALRTIRPGELAEGMFDGSGLIEHLSHLRNADFDEDEIRRQDQRLLAIVRAIFDDANAEYSVPQTQESVNLLLGGEFRRLEMLGTGIEHMLLCVTAAMLSEGKLLAIEEPELHLHPRYQRSLMEFLHEETDAQIVIASHSAHIIDSTKGTTIAVRLESHQTHLGRAADLDLLAVLDDLGYRASDFLQSNCIIWVEGPSDRIYLNHWIREHFVGSRFIEGVHYSIMHYGGALLAHLEAATTSPTVDRINLRRLNQRLALVADSDRASTSDPLKPRLQTFIDEIEQVDQPWIWVTEGREIENYIDHEAFRDAAMAVHPSVIDVPEYGQFGNPFRLLTSDDGSTLASPDKVEIAHWIVKNRPTVTNNLNLLSQLDLLHAFLAAANT